MNKTEKRNRKAFISIILKDLLMELDLSASCLRALNLAFHIALEDGKFEPTSKHCIKALLADPDGPVTSFLKDFGLVITQLSFPENYASWESLSEVLESVKKPEFAKKILRTSKLVLGEQEGTSLGFLVYLIEVFPDSKMLLENLGIDLVLLNSWIDKQRLQPLVLDVPLDLTMDFSLNADSSLRILDAAANRVREGLRVIDDYCRFILSSSELCLLAKKLRHDFNEALKWIPAIRLISHRNVEEDVGTSTHTAQEISRLNEQDVFIANIKRVQESFRSLEEFGKIESPDFALQIGELRYRSYELEQKISRAINLVWKLNDVKIYGLIGIEELNENFIDTLKALLENGLDMIQLRVKSFTDLQLLRHALQLKTLIDQNHKLLIINDRPDIAKIIDADGVHLGQDDLPVKAAKLILGSNKIIGVSTHNAEQMQIAIQDGADYLGVGPVFNSLTKTFSHVAGLPFVKQASAACELPWFAIGGINPDNISQLRENGAKRIAISHALFHSENPLKTLKILRKYLA